ncbi:MAG: S-methyl-5-thioribose-1-phosphate isomerase [Promethearchaeota archaeon]|nr:MAG: S-methyl-5-thioribose-1-phosphate isomerase [Candidatus Lokiarchaeota archaeon]
MIPSIEWKDESNTVRMIDQTLLPHELVFLEFKDFRGVANSIKIMNIRGAPAIGVAAAMGMALAALEFQYMDTATYISYMKQAANTITATRPTAVNLFWAVKRMLNVLEKNLKKNPKDITNMLIEEAKGMWKEDIDTNRAIGKHGAHVLVDGDTVLTHCNAGSLATVQYGTALAPVRWAIEEQGKKIQVIANETRPRLQGARLTAYELQYDKIPVKVQSDNCSGLIMMLGNIDKVIVGADRIVSDAVFNKIGTYLVALAAKRHNIPFYVAAPESTLSLDETRKDVTIEQRDGKEVANVLGKVHIVPDGVEIINFAFDITPFDLITGIITEHGIFKHRELLKRYKSSFG